jgi:4-aminobutyrate aminotransferase-like enzyme
MNDEPGNHCIAHDVDAGKKYAADVKNLIDYGTSGRVRAFIAESIQGVGGSIFSQAVI